MGRRVMCAYPGCGERTRPAEGVTVAFGETRRVRYCGVFHALWGLIRLAGERRSHRPPRQHQGVGAGPGSADPAPGNPVRPVP